MQKIRDWRFRYEAQGQQKKKTDEVVKDLFALGLRREEDGDDGDARDKLESTKCRSEGEAEVGGAGGVEFFRLTAERPLRSGGSSLESDLKKQRWWQ
ncbi:unnamed protein product [Caenorhabditis sp. 36 PRJEB53466]|nr:unnamed protein product [Caenorhabditis sp. 36 PRJEB53466]